MDPMVLKTASSTRSEQKRGRGRPTVPVDLRVVVGIARDEFARRGFEVVTLQDVATRAGVSKAALYYHYPTKAELYDAVLEEDASYMLQLVVEARLNDGSHVERLHRLGSMMCDAFAGRPAIARLVLRELVGHGRYVSGSGGQRLEEILTVVAAFFEGGMAAGAFRKADARQLAVSVAGVHLFAFAATDFVSPFLGGDITTGPSFEARKAAVLEHVALMCGVVPIGERG